MVPTTYKEVMVPLDPEQMADIYAHIIERDGTASVGKVAEYLAGIGLRSPRTRRPFTRQNVFLALQKSKRYKKLVPSKPRSW